MKTYILFLSGFLMIFMTSCRHSSEKEPLPEEEITLLNEPTDVVTVTMGDKTFTVDFRINECCLDYIEYTFQPMEQLKTREDLIHLFKSISPHYMLNPGIETDVNDRQSYALKVEYMLAQECFSDGCDSETRRDILQLLVNNQKAMNIRDFPPYCARKSSVFLMAVILLKERDISEKYIDNVILQQALLCLNTDIDGVSKVFSDLIIERCVMFLKDGTNQEDKEESTLLHEPTDEVTVTVGDKDFTVDFRFDPFCKQFQDNYSPTDRQAAMKSRDDLINFYESITPYSFLISSQNMVFYTESHRIYFEYLLAQECFSDECDSEVRREVLSLIIINQKAKYDYREGIRVYAPCAQKCGVFLMAVILLKERNDSAKFIDDNTLQQALLCLNSDTWGVNEEFSDLIIECCEKFLNE